MKNLEYFFIAPIGTFIFLLLITNVFFVFNHMFDSKHIIFIESISFIVNILISLMVGIILLSINPDWIYIKPFKNLIK